MPKAAKSKGSEPVPEKKTARKSAPEKVEEIYLQFGGEEWALDGLKARAVAAYVAEGHRASAIRSLVLYLKPEERRAYYVVNGKATGSVDF